MPDPAVAVTAAVSVKNGFDKLAKMLICKLPGAGPGGQVKAAAWQAKNTADMANARAGAGLEFHDYRPPLLG
jgi:hypothetical protein